MATRCFCPPESSEGHAFSLSGSPTFSRRSRAIALACLWWRPFTSMGAIVMLCSTFLCGKSWNCWNTIPMCWRTLSRFVFFGSIGSPLTRISPSSGNSRKLMQRSSVLFPEPDGPMMTTTSPGSTVRSMPLSTCMSPKLL